MEQQEELYIPRLLVRYRAEIAPALIERFGYTSPMQAPTLTKVCINSGVGKAKEDFSTLEAAVREIAKIIGQAPVITRAKKSISAFGIRQGMPIGLRVTLRGPRMWEFTDKLFSLALPRIRDFRGLPRDAFDGRGNYTLGLTDLLIFPELGYDDVERQRGMDITIVTTARTDEESMALLEGLGLPLAREQQ